MGVLFHRVSQARSSSAEVRDRVNLSGRRTVVSDQKDARGFCYWTSQSAQAENSLRSCQDVPALDSSALVCCNRIRMSDGLSSDRPVGEILWDGRSLRRHHGWNLRVAR